MRDKEMHGHAPDKGQSPEYVAWRDMVQRCTNPSCRKFARYGGRGIGVCDSWRDSFVSFLSDMGERPSDKHSLDRIDNNLGYSPANCRWATWKTQARNRCNNNVIEIDGVERTLTEWCELHGIHQSTFRKRILSGMTSKDALTKPVKYKKPSRSQI